METEDGVLISENLLTPIFLLPKLPPPPTTKFGSVVGRKSISLQLPLHPYTFSSQRDT